MKFVHPVILEPEGGWYSELFTLIEPILVYLTEKKIWDHEFFFGQKLCGFRWNDPIVKFNIFTCKIVINVLTMSLEKLSKPKFKTYFFIFYCRTIQIG